jgi:hypothetical protein
MTTKFEVGDLIVARSNIHTIHNSDMYTWMRGVKEYGWASPGRIYKVLEAHESLYVTINYDCGPHLAAGFVPASRKTLFNALIQGIIENVPECNNKTNA